MKNSSLSLYALCVILCVGVSVLPGRAEEEQDKQEEKAGTDTLEEGSKEWKRAKLIACQKQTANEFKDIRQLANLLKKAKNDRDFEKVNKLSAGIIKKYSPLYLENVPAKVNGIEITTDDLKPSHVKLGSKRRKLYKDFVEFSEKQRARQERSNWGNYDNEEESGKKSKKKNKKEKEEDVAIDMQALEKVKAILHVNQEDFASEIDTEIEEKNQKNSPYPNH